MRAHYLVWEDPLEKEVATPSSILAWEIPWTEETYGPQRVHRVTKSQDTTRMTLQQQQQLLLLLLSRFSRVRLCATPQTVAHQAPLFLGFSRQEHWSGLPFPSPMQESET